MYATEKDFSKAFCNKLSRIGYMITRIESHGTRNGIPDMHVCGFGYDCFIELKNDKKHGPNTLALPVEWRPGQQAWMLDYFLKHKHTKNCLTIVAVDGGYYIIPMTCIYQQSTVFSAQHLFISDDDWCRVRIPRVLHAMTTNMMGYYTYREAVIDLVEQFYCPDMDYDPEVLWNKETVDTAFDSTVFNTNKLEILLTLEATMKASD